MEHRLLDENGSPIYGAGTSSMANGDNATILNVVTRIKSYKGDCFFDLEANLDWNNILSSKTTYPIERVNEDVKRTVLESDNVKSIASFTGSLKSRQYSAIIEFITDDNTALTVSVEVEA